MDLPAISQMRFLHHCLFFVLWIGALATAQGEQALTIVDDGVGKAVIVVGNLKPEIAEVAAADLQSHVQKASGASLQIITEDEATKLDPHTTRIVIGAGDLSRELGVTSDDLDPEEFQIRTFGRDIVIVANDIGTKPRRRPIHPHASPATHFAVTHLLDHYLGVRWLWPGELGAMVPKRSTIELPPLDVTGQPVLLGRGFLVALPRHRGVAGTPNRTHDKMVAEAYLWMDRHHMGSRSELRFGHAFTKWWERFHESNPSYFAVPPVGEEQRSPKGVKLCTSNPAVIDQVIADWEAAGEPRVWNVCPNDGIGFCTCQDCLALDEGGPHPAEVVWAPGGRVDLSARHVIFQNAVLKRMKTVRPDATLCAFAYGAYRNPPQQLPVEPGMVLEFVHGYQARDEWRGWSDLGVKLALRPNWLHSGANAPYLTLHEVGDFLRFGREHGMVQHRFDSLNGYWATQGPNYYLIARLSSRPDLSVDDVIAEYTSAFGPAEPAIHRWLDYWLAYSAKLEITIAAGGEVSVNPDGLYERTCRQHGLPTHPLLGSWEALPHLYNEDVLTEADTILKDAAKLAANDLEASERVQFLKDGLRFLRATRDLIATAQKAEEHEDLQRRIAELRALNLELSPQHVVWGDVVLGAISKRIFKDEIDMRGL